MDSFDPAAAPDPEQVEPAAVSVSVIEADAQEHPDDDVLDELALRRTDFEEGYPVVLADGQAWHFRRPRIYFRPSEDSSGFAIGLADGPDPEMLRLRRQLDDLGPGSLIREWARIELMLASHALRLNYDLTLAQTADLLHFAYEEMGESDPNAVRIREEVMAVLNGNAGPKLRAGGDGS